MAAPDLRGRLEERGFLISAWSSLTQPELLERMLQGGFDLATFDMQHGMHDEASVGRGIATASHMGMASLVRVPVGGYATVSRVLDYGATGVILPMIESADDARALVAAAKYPPLGQRSYGPTRAVMLHGYGSGKAYFEAANRETLAFAMIETPAAYAALDQILAVEGLDGVFIGPSDLSIALTGGRLSHDGPEVTAAIQTIAAKARACGKFTALYVFDADETAGARKMGVDLVTLSSDMAIFNTGLAALRASTGR